MKRALFYFLFLFSHFAFAIENNVAVTFVEKAASLRLSETPQWQKILFYQRKYFTSRRGIVDGENFYLAKDGRQNPEHEMNATLKSFFSGKQGDLATQCQFPRRLKWLKEHLDTAELKIPQVECPKLNSWLKNIAPQGVALVFSSFFINNPSSMFGHSFLRIINSDYSLTDYGVNYAANPRSFNVFSYTLNGLFGGFSGKFSLLPYSVKVQEYNNSESRDLYEYELNLTHDETVNMILSLWEVGDNNINYYYVDENCSYILLALLDSANPNFNFIDKFMFIGNPADTLRVVNETPNLVKNIVFRPSAQHRFMARYVVLNEDEKNLFRDIIDEKINLNSLSKTKESKESEAKVLTAVSEYIDYKENIAGTGDVDKYPPQRKKILLARAELGVVSPPLKKQINALQRPDAGVHGSRLGLSYNYSTRVKSVVNAEFRPALHDLASPQEGYSPDSQIELLNTKISYETKTNSLYVNEFSLANIISLPSFDEPLYPISWGLQASMKSDDDCQFGFNSANCERYFLSGLSGLSLRKSWTQIYFLPNLQIGYMNEFGFESLMGARAGFLFRPTGKINFSGSGELLHRYSISQKIWRFHEVFQSCLAFNFAKEMEGRIFIHYNAQTSNWNFGAGLYWYFF